tara:strand:- start:1043 stop:1681 length:639 start_codon:yes stop_codon:yes gene_type:complete
VRNSNLIKIWLIKDKYSFKPITDEEELLARNLTLLRGNQFRHSRGYVREVLSSLFGIPPLKIPLNSPPGKPPELPLKFGYISFSHCNDCLLICWSTKTIGVDIERKDRLFDHMKIMDVFYSETEKKYIRLLKKSYQKNAILKLWNLKEAAIKLQRGRIVNDLRLWLINENFKDAFHILNEKRIKVFHMNYQNWSVGLASNDEIINPIICIYN